MNKLENFDYKKWWAKPSMAEPLARFDGKEGFCQQTFECDCGCLKQKKENSDK